MKSFSTVDDILPTYTVVCGFSVGVTLGMIAGLITGGMTGPRIIGGRDRAGTNPTGPSGRGGNVGRTIDEYKEG